MPDSHWKRKSFCMSMPWREVTITTDNNKGRNDDTTRQLYNYAPTMFQAFINKVFRDLMKSCAIVYINNNINPASSTGPLMLRQLSRN